MLILLSALALAPAANEGATNPSTTPMAVTCPKSTGKEITVCAEPLDRSPYRIDPAIAAVNRTKEDPGTPEPGYQSIGVEPCPPQGIKLCPGQDTIPVFAIARVAAEAALLAAHGEDWRKPLRTQTDIYDEYRAAKDKEARRKSDRKPRFGIMSGR